jgi:hypothetical protein
MEGMVETTTDQKSLEVAITERVRRSGSGAITITLESNESYTLYEPVHIGQDFIEFSPSGYAEDAMIVAIWSIISMRFPKSARHATGESAGS